MRRPGRHSQGARKRRTQAYADDKVAPVRLRHGIMPPPVFRYPARSLAWCRQQEQIGDRCAANASSKGLAGTTSVAEEILRAVAIDLNVRSLRQPARTGRAVALCRRVQIVRRSKGKAIV